MKLRWRRREAALRPAVRELLGHVVFTDSSVWAHYELAGQRYLMGGTIMGSSPKDSVVDGDCRTHDHANLWLPGGGAMPSASVVNSTLSMAALGLKSADSISKSMGSRG